MISKLSAKYQFCAIHTADNTDGKSHGRRDKSSRGINITATPSLASPAASGTGLEPGQCTVGRLAWP